MTDNYKNLLIGCGNARDKRLEPAAWINGAAPHGPRKWVGQLHTLDLTSSCKPNMVWDLNVIPWRDGCEPIPSNCYDEVHAYEVLEHLGRLGDYRAFFATFEEIYRVLKPGGFLCATVPSRRSQWALGDPGHTRVILPCTLVFLQQPEYERQRGVTTMSDYRDVYAGDFDVVHSYDNDNTHQFILQAVKPPRRAP